MKAKETKKQAVQKKNKASEKTEKHVETSSEQNIPPEEWGKPTYDDLVAKLKKEGEVRNVLLRKISRMSLYCHEVKNLIDKNAYGKAIVHFCDMYRFVEWAMNNVTEDESDSEG